MAQDGIQFAPTVQSGADEPIPLRPGDKAGDYEIVRRLGGGAMGDVFEGIQPTIGKKVAIKVIKNVLAKSSKSAERFLREAQAVNRVDHDNVLDIFAFGRLDDGRLYLVMDLLEGETLAQRIKRKGAFDVAAFEDTFTIICDAVQAAHKAGIVHRDLKPDNIFVTDEGKVYVLDFGIAKMVRDAAGDEAQATLTSKGAWLGTPAYMAPEQWSASGATAQSDVYALGAMGYQMLSGQLPYSADSVPGVMELHFHGDIPTAEGAPKHIARALAKAMAKNPADRFSGAGELGDAIRGNVAVAAPRRHSKGAGGQAVLFAVGGGVVVALCAAALFILKNTDPEPAESETESATAGDQKEVELHSLPVGAAVYFDGQKKYETPYKILVKPGEPLELVFTKPGYLPKTAVVTAATKDPIRLLRVEGFRGIWKTADDKIRKFERSEDRVLVYRQNNDGHVEHHGTFEFTNDGFEFEDFIIFQAQSDYIHESLHEEPSCIIPLKAQYRFTPKTGVLDARNESIALAVQDGRCVKTAPKAWSSWKAATRMTDAPPAEAVIATSTAGGGGQLAKNPAPKLKRKPKPNRKQPPNKRPSPPQALSKEDIANQSDDFASNVLTPGKEPVQKQAPPVQKKAPPVQKTKARKAPPTKGAAVQQKASKSQAAIPSDRQLK
jgi:tRNA A-37 threonylcarbamoyl transferase component Bud32